MKEFWDERFASEEYLYGELPNVQFKRFIDENKPGKILLPGEGEGRNAVYASQQGWQVWAIDQSDEGKKKAEKLAHNHKVDINYITGDLLKAPFDADCFDAVALVFFHLPTQIRLNIHAHLYHLLNNSGKMFITGFSKEQLKYQSGGPKDIEMLYTPEILANDFSQMKIVKNIRFNEHLNEGVGHQGIASLIEFEALKS